jgi:hypothetical protein
LEIQPMPTRLSILNTALGHLKEPVAPDLVSLRTNAEKVYAQLDVCRQAILERHGWLCALEYETLQQAADISNWKYDAGFWLPADALRVWVVGEENPPYPVIKWEAGTKTVAGVTRKVIWADGVTELDVAYVRDAPAEALTANLADAIAYELAARTCGGVNGSEALAAKLAKEAPLYLAYAVGVDGTQEGGQDAMLADVPALVRAGVA